MEILSQIFELLINRVYELTKDYGVAAIITIAIRSCLVPLNIRQRKQMQKQKETSLRVEELKAKYTKPFKWSRWPEQQRFCYLG